MNICFISAGSLHQQKIPAKMRYPTTRYGHHGEFEFWMQGCSVKVIAKRLKRSERSEIPWWVPEILRLQHYEYQDRLRQMGISPPRRRLAIVTAGIFQFPKPTAATQPELKAVKWQLHSLIPTNTSNDLKPQESRRIKPKPTQRQWQKL